MKGLVFYGCMMVALVLCVQGLADRWWLVVQTKGLIENRVEEINRILGR
jgi:hypothetical protein